MGKNEITCMSRRAWLAGAGASLAWLAARKLARAVEPEGPASNVPDYGVARRPPGIGPDDEFQRVRFHECAAAILNPHRGTATMHHFNGRRATYPGIYWDDCAPVGFPPADSGASSRDYPDCSVAYCRWYWRLIEPEPERYRWDIVEDALKIAGQSGQTLQIRIASYPTIPRWYRDLGKMMSAEDADMNDPIWLKYFGGMIREFGRRFDGHPNLESVDVVVGGYFGEHGGNATPETSAAFVELYRECFKNTQLVSMIDTHACRYASKYPAFGWRADCLGDLRSDGAGGVPDSRFWNHMYDEYPHSLSANGIADAWKTAPVTFETGWTVPHWAVKNWDVDWILAQALKYHPSVFMPKSCFIPEKWKEKFAAFDRRLGYRFVLRQARLPVRVKAGGAVAFDMSVDNVGVAPIYCPYRLAFNFRQGRTSEVVEIDTDPRQWLPDYTWISSSVKMPPVFEPGEVEVFVGIIDAKTRKPRVRFAIEECGPDGWHPLTSIRMT